MATLTLGPVIGKIGGADVEVIPVNIVARGREPVIMHTVRVPEGETWLVVLAGDLNPRFTTTGGGPEISIGEVTIGPGLPEGYTLIVTEVTGTAEIAIKRQTTLSSDDFVGHIYVAPLP